MAKYKRQYGISNYTKDQKQLHEDIMELLGSVRYKEIPADDCIVVFGRIYSIYICSQLLKEKKILINKEVKPNSSQH